MLFVVDLISTRIFFFVISSLRNSEFCYYKKLYCYDVYFRRICLYLQLNVISFTLKVKLNDSEIGPTRGTDLILRIKWIKSYLEW